jgi:OmpA-OmpF porin, OOP family
MSFAQQVNQIDDDNDGVANCFDKCPNTVQGIVVDTKGCPKDTDGDGVFDYQDKELITATQCQPSDSNGIGWCAKNRFQLKEDSVMQYSKQTFYFDIGATSNFKTEEDRNNVWKYLNLIKKYPQYYVVISGNGNSMLEQQLSWERVYLIYDYFIKNNVDSSKLIFEYGRDGKNNSVDVYFSKNNFGDSASIPPPPHPSRLNNKKRRKK